MTVQFEKRIAASFDVKGLLLENINFNEEAKFVEKNKKRSFLLAVFVGLITIIFNQITCQFDFIRKH